MIRCGLSTPQVHSIVGSGFPTDARVLVTMPDGTVSLPVVPLTITSTVITFSFVFATCGTYTFQVSNAAGACDAEPSNAVTLTLTPEACPRLDVPLTLGDLRVETQHRLGDDDGTIWSNDEVSGVLVDAYLLVATQIPVFWDQVYLENLPRGFSYTQPWEWQHLNASGRFDYGVGNFTAEFERLAGTSLGWDPRKRYGPANHTSPFEATDGLLGRAGASTAIPATVELSKLVTTVDRALWDTRTIDALDPRSYSRMDARYEINIGDVFGYMWQKDGVRTFRKVRVPAHQGSTVTVNGSWGVLRTPTDISATTPTGTWGLPRIIDGQHPIGGEFWGTPRRVYLDGWNVRVEVFRQGRVMDADSIVCELPPRYALYLRDYAMSACLSRPGPGCDQQLAEHFDQRWKRGLARIQRRMTLVNMEDVHVMGGDGRPSVFRPPRPSLPANYGSRVR